MTIRATGQGILLAALALGLACPAAAQESLPPAGAAKAVAAPEPAPEAFHPNIDLTTAPIGGCPVPGCQESGRFFFQADYLLMQPRRRALDFAISDPNRNGLAEGNVESVQWESDSGVRAGGGYRLGSGWEVGTYYTYFYSATQRTVNAPANGTLYATLTHPGFVDAVDSATGTSSFKYQLFDLEFGRHVDVSDNTSVYLSAGGRYAWIDQALNATYNGQSAFQDRVSTPINFDGGGIRVGAEGDWKMAYGFGLYANAHGSLLMGTFRTRLTEANNAGAAVISNVSERFEKMVPVAELGLGVSYQNENFRARIGYEMSNWFGLVDSPDFVHDFTNKLSHRVGDLSLDGLTVRLEVGF